MTFADTRSHLIGHDEAMRQVAEAFASSRMHHAWLIAGIEGIGKTALAMHIAHHVLSNGENKLGNIDGKHPAARLINAEAHPDMLVIRRATNDKGELRDMIVVEDALKIAAFLHKTSTHNGWRVVVIDEAHALNRHSQNAILKILEEPPARALIIMTATSAGALLPTIRSRCRLLSLEPLDDTHMRSILAKQAPEVDGNMLDSLIALAGGSIGFAMKVIRTETLPLYEELLTMLRGLPKLETVRLHKLADQIGRKADAESFDVVTTLLMDILRQNARAKATGQGTHMLPQMTLDHALTALEATRATFAASATANLDHKLAFINAVSDIRRAVA